jgi:hypothetical protein
MSKKELPPKKKHELSQKEIEQNSFFSILLINYWKFKYPKHEVENILHRWSADSILAAIKRHFAEIEAQKNELNEILATFEGLKLDKGKKLKRKKVKGQLDILTKNSHKKVNIVLRDTLNELQTFFCSDGLRNEKVFSQHAQFLADEVNSTIQRKNPKHKVDNFQLADGVVSFDYHFRQEKD